MTVRIELMKKHIAGLNDAGLRKTTFFPLIAESLKATQGEAGVIRRARAFEHLLDNVEQDVHSYELLAGSITGMWPVDEDVKDYETRKREAVRVVESYLAKKRAGEIDMTVRRGRGAFMLRDHYDANINYYQLQKLLAELWADYGDNPDIQPHEIGREVTSFFNYDYGEETRRLFDELPWDAANHMDFNYKDVVKKGFGCISEDAARRLASAADSEKRDFYFSAKLCVDAAIRFIHRYAQKLLAESSSSEITEQRAGELRGMADTCKKIAEGKPEDFRQALQLVWITHIIANIAGGSALSFARFDQYMYPFYKKDKDAGRISEEEAKELLCCMWLKVNEPRMRTVQSLCIGGVTPEGEDGANELTRLCLEVTARLKLPYPNVSVRVKSGKSPEWLYDETIKTIKVGGGQPMLLNDDVWVPNLEKLGYSAQVAREYYNMGCTEILIQGKSTNWANADALNFPRTLNNLIGKIESGGSVPGSFEEFLGAYLTEIREQIKLNIQNGLQRLSLVRDNCYEPFASAIVEGCLESGTDFFRNGTACPPHLAMTGIGLGTAIDSLSAVKKFVYDDKRVTFNELIAALNANFAGYEQLRTALSSMTPAYGNDIDETDRIAELVFKTYSDEIFSYNGPEKTEKYVNVLFSYNSHVAAGETVGATPNGRLRGETLSDAIGPSQGKDTEGPTSMLNSVLKLDNRHITGAYALNLKINSSLVRDASGTAALKSLIKGYLDSNGPQIQVNFVSLEDLKDALISPDKHRELVVRIAGYCEYFVNLDLKLQHEIIQRTEHEVG